MPPSGPWARRRPNSDRPILVADGDAVAGRVGRNQGGVVHHTEQRRLQQLAHGDGSLHPDHRLVGEDHAALAHRVHGEAAGIDRSEIVKELGLAGGHLALQVLDMLGRKLEVLQELERILQTSENGELSLERILSEEDIEGSHLVLASQLPVGVGHGDLGNHEKRVETHLVQIREGRVDEVVHKLGHMSKAM